MHKNAPRPIISGFLVGVYIKTGAPDKNKLVKQRTLNVRTDESTMVNVLCNRFHVHGNSNKYYSWLHSLKAPKSHNAKSNGSRFSH